VTLVDVSTLVDDVSRLLVESLMLSLDRGEYPGDQTSCSCRELEGLCRTPDAQW
jgi:hypothetical protein